MLSTPMLRLYLCLCAPLLPLGAVSAQTAPKVQANESEWIRYTPPEGVFSILFPGKPERTVGDIAADQGGPGKTYFYTVTPGDSLFLAGWGQYRSDFKFDNQAELDANRDNFIKGIDARIDSQRKIARGSAPGLEFEFSKQGVLFGRGRIYIIDGKPFQFVFMHRGTVLDTARANRFLDSFRTEPNR